jgi:hypothetical protein
MGNDTRFYPITFDGVDHNLPSVTSVIGKTQAKPQLNAWYYRTTVESISGLIQVLQGMGNFSAEILETLSDPEDTIEYLTEAGMTPDAVAEEASVRGREAHRLLHRISLAQQLNGDGAAEKLAIAAFERSYAPGQAWCRGVGAWYLERRPTVIAAEEQVFRIEGDRGYAGTLDLLYSDDDIFVTMDLKTRKEQLPEYRVRKAEWITPEPPVWESDQIQVKAYEAARQWMEMNDVIPRKMVYFETRATVLAVEANGHWVEKEATIPAKVFDNLLDNYYLLGGKGGRA